MLAAKSILSYRQSMLGDKKHRHMSLVQGFAAVIGIGGTLAVAWIGVAWVTTLWLGILLTSVIVIVLHRKGAADNSSLGLLETPFYLSHDTEIFERYKKISQQMLRVSQRTSAVFRELALQRFDKMAADCTSMGQGQIVFTETETWRIAYEQLLRDPVVFFYRSVSIVRHSRYWQDAAGTGSMQLNFQLIDQTDERIARQYSRHPLSS